MSKRSARKRKAPQYSNHDMSAAYYVGYAEDGESVEAIMKKFEELEKFQKEVSHKDSLEGPVVECSEADATVESPDTIMNQSQLEELFKRTSAFTVKTVAQSEMLLGTEEFDEMELWRLEHGEYPGEWEEEDEYQILDENGDDWRDEEPKLAKVRRERPTQKSTGVSKVAIDKETLLDRYKLIQVPMQDKTGNFFWMKKKVVVPDVNLPTYIRIPAAPMPRSWIKNILSLSTVKDQMVSGRSMTENILTFDLKQLGSAFQAILMDPPLQSPDYPANANRITLDQFASLDISSVNSHGFLFIWVEKELLPDILKIGQMWGFRYVENLAWIKKNLNNTIATQPSRYYNKSKTTCLVLRKEGEIELRHQRNADCEFDFIKPVLNVIESVNEEKPQYIYQVIETLLPQAMCQADPNGGLLELWARQGHQRKGWTAIAPLHI